MKKILLSASALAGGMLLATGAFAQTSTPPNADASQSTDGSISSTDNTVGVRPDTEAQDVASSGTGGNDIIVTGSRIARPALDSVVPITSITADELLASASLNVGDQLNDLPQLRSTYSQANSTRFIGTSGLNLLDLRGLGTSRTLVLVNNRRHVTAVPGTATVDTNTIPNDLLERVDVVTGGNSAVYGSDAIAGVVNFVLKQDFDGLALNAQGGVSTYGDRGQGYVSAVWGRNFDEGRGNFVFAGEYSHANPIYYRDRDFETGAYSGRNQFNTNEITADDGPTGSDGIPDTGFYRGVRNGNISNGGILNAVCLVAQRTNAARCRQNSNFVTYYGTGLSQANYTAFLGQRYGFDTGGNLVLSNPTLDFRDITAGASTNTVGGLGSTLNETGMIVPRQDRVSINALGHYDFSEAFTVYYEGKYVNIYQNQEGQPSFFQNGAITFSPTGGTAQSLVLTRCNNGFLSATSLATLQSIGYCAAGATSTATIPISRFNVDFGGRGELIKRETYRFVGGVRGTFNDDWHYDASVTYGRLQGTQRSQNNLLVQRFANAANAVLAPANYAGSNFVLNSAGQRVVCSINADASTTNDDTGCIPINLFGYGAPSQAALNYTNTTSLRRYFADQFDAIAYVSGDLSQLFELPGGPVAFSAGAEYRREDNRSVYDPVVTSGQTFLNAIQPFTPPVLEVKEAFGELSIPLLKNLPFARELTLNGAARVSDYNNSAGTVFAWSAGAIYAPADFIRFRGNYSKSVRVPTQSDLYSPFSQNFAQLADPCDSANITAGQYRTANCAAAGIPANFINTPARSASTSYLSGGNRFLTAETSKSYTVGAVFEPRSAIPGLSITIDYYNITVNNLIATLGAQTILNQCYDSPSGINNQYCALITRNPDGTFASNGIVSSGVNYARLKTSGIDLNYAYNRTFANGDKAGISVIATWVAERTGYTNPADPNFADRFLTEQGDPEWEVQATASYTKGPFTLRYQFQYIAPMSIYGSAYETMNAFDGRPATNPDAYPVAFNPSYTYHNLRAAVNVNKDAQFYFGVDNVLNTLPPYGQFGNGQGDAIYDAIGRSFYAGIKVRL